MAEPINDHFTLDCILEEQRKDLVFQSWQYILALEDYVVRLRIRINDLTDDLQQETPYPDSASDFAVRFYDHPAYEEFSNAMTVGEPGWRIID